MIQDLHGLDFGPILALNNEHAMETSELDASRLKALLDMACYARGVDGGATALLIALDQEAGYENPNFAWFKAAYERFVYIDRVIVADAARGRGIARALYEDLFFFAKDSGQERVVCEVNLDPPNAASDAFHAAMGFEAVGQNTIHGGAKTVRYFAKVL
ncbi:hypothetical protein HDF16_000451 [Granulicella aggregans]|uniref:N-acetyltransferase domain-containing protein n=1 Tax=Granulicella aggregans TaxID=474949 RepID=A0A7W7Z9S7_9BACT|nr:GNAT family N-acetyltransferase [Granulicella aggregans]MBB5055782.1 hypothetical protein [Granulicella aggregans]